MENSRRAIDLKRKRRVFGRVRVVAGSRFLTTLNWLYLIGCWECFSFFLSFLSFLPSQTLCFLEKKLLLFNSDHWSLYSSLSTVIQLNDGALHATFLRRSNHVEAPWFELELEQCVLQMYDLFCFTFSIVLETPVSRYSIHLRKMC